MGFVGLRCERAIGSTLRGLASTVVVGILATGCVAQSDPANPCAAMDLGEPEPATMVALQDAPVLAVAGDPEPFVLHYVCSDDDFDSCALTKTFLRDVSADPEDPTSAPGPGSAVMISGTGRWVVSIDESTGHVYSYEVHRDTGLEPSDPVLRSDATPRMLVASMRGGDTMIVRDWEKNLGRLARFDPGTTTAHPIAPELPGLRVATVGERYVVGRILEGDGVEELYLVPADKELEVGSKPIKLIRGEGFSRVALTPGDAQVIATSGDGADAETFVFSVPDGDLLDRFVGAAITSRRPLDSVPGMQVVSPDGSHAVYRTPSGAIALRNVDNQTSCMLRSSHAGSHQVAGFSAAGLVYIESESAVGQSRILAFDPKTRHLAALGDPEADVGVHLAALPARSHDEADRAWAVSVADGAYYALQEDEPKSALGLDDVIFMPRDDTGVWVTNTRRDQYDGSRTLTVRRIDPRPQGADRILMFDEDDAVTVGDEPVQEHLARTRVCMSTGVPGSWGYRCGRPGETGFLAGSDTPASEDPNTDRLDPEVPDLPGSDDEE